MLSAMLALAVTLCVLAAIGETIVSRARMLEVSMLRAAGAEPFKVVAVSAAAEDVEDERMPTEYDRKMRL
jgi:hypothetical protein